MRPGAEGAGSGAVAVDSSRPPVVRITLTGANGNRLDRATVAGLTDAVLRAERTPGTRLLVLDAVGEVFCAGVAIEDLEDPGWRRWVSALHRLTTTLIESRLVTVALVDAPVVGGGVGLVAACDQVLVGPAARFRLTEVVLGLVPALVLPLVVHRVGAAAALSLALSATELTAREALAAGLADRLSDEVEQALRALVARIRVTDHSAVAAVKRHHAALTARRLEPVAAVIELLEERLADPATGARIARFRDQGVIP